VILPGSHRVFCGVLGSWKQLHFFRLYLMKYVVSVLIQKVIIHLKNRFDNMRAPLFPLCCFQRQLLV